MIHPDSRISRRRLKAMRWKPNAQLDFIHSEQEGHQLTVGLSPLFNT
jgi:hypothetical protein